MEELPYLATTSNSYKQPIIAVKMAIFPAAVVSVLIRVTMQDGLGIRAE